MLYKKLIRKYTKVTPNKWFHITKRNIGETTVLIPSINYSPIGVSFTPSIKRCLEALPLFYFDIKDKVNTREGGRKLHGSGRVRHFTFYVYTPIKRYIAVIPSTCDDIKRSKERRVLRKVKAKRMGIIKVTSRESWSGKQIYNLRYEWLKSNDGRGSKMLNFFRRLKTRMENYKSTNYLVKMGLVEKSLDGAGVRITPKGNMMLLGLRKLSNREHR